MATAALGQNGSFVARPPYQDTAALNTLSERGTPPKARISDPDQAQEIVHYLIHANRTRTRREAQQKAMFDGNAPYNSFKLKAAGRGWEANFNTMEGKARKAAAKVPYYDLHAGSRTYFEIETDFGDEADQVRWGRIMTEEADRTAKEWIGFSFNMWSMLDDFIGYGKGFLFFQDPWRWRFRKVAQSRVLVHDGTDCDLEEGLEMIVVRQSFLAHELWRYIKEPERARTIGWNPDAVIRAIRDAQPDANADTWDNPVKIQQRLKDCDLYVTSRPAKVDVAHLFVREFDGSISEQMVLENGETATATGDRTRGEWLFNKVGRYDAFSQIVAPFFFEMEDGSWHGCSGLGQDIFAQMQTKDRLTMSSINSAFMRGALLLQAKTPAAMKNAGLQLIGNAVMIPPDVTAQSSQILGDIESPLLIAQALETAVDSNTGVYRPRMEKPSGNPEPATSTQLRFAQSNVLSSSAADRFLRQEDHLYTEVIRRMFASQYGDDASAKSAKECKKRCEERGVPPEAWDKIKVVRASRTLGNGSIVMRQSALTSLAPFSARWPESGRQAFDEDVVEAFAGESKVSRYVPESAKTQLPDDHRAMAMMENGVMKTGAPVTWTPTQNSMIHAQTHLEAMAGAVQSLSKGADMGQVYSFLETAGPHVSQHLSALSQDPTRQGAVKVLTKQLKGLGQITDQLGAKVKEQAQAQQQAQAIQSGMDPDTQLKAAETQAKAKNAEFKVMHSAQLKQKQVEQKLAIERAQAQQDMALKDAQTAQDIALKRAQAAAEPKGEE